MKRLASVLALALLAATPVAARSYRLGSLEAADPWTRPAPAGATGVGYLKLSNTGKAPVSLVSAASPAAKAVTLHRTTVTGGVARMAQITNGLAIPPGGSAVLEPGGYHLMLEGLAKPLAIGQAAPVTLTFSNGQKLQIDLAVQTGAGAPMANMPGMDHSGH